MPDMPAAFYAPAFAFLVGTGGLIIRALWADNRILRKEKDDLGKEGLVALREMASSISIHTEAIKTMQHEAIRLLQTVVRSRRKEE